MKYINYESIEQKVSHDYYKALKRFGYFGIIIGSLLPFIYKKVEEDPLSAIGIYSISSTMFINGILSLQCAKKIKAQNGLEKILGGDL